MSVNRYQPTHDHCWHPTGVSATAGFSGGSDEVVCCHCNTYGQRTFHYERQSIDGHGPYVTEKVKVVDGVTYGITLEMRAHPNGFESPNRIPDEPS